MNMQVDDAGHHVLTVQIDDLRRRRRLQLCRRPYPLDAPVVENHGRMGYWGVAGAVDQSEVLEYLDFCNQGSCKQQQQADRADYFEFVRASSRILLARDGLKIPQEQKRER